MEPRPSCELVFNIWGRCCWGDVIFANGLTDPSLSSVDLLESNTSFPLRVIAAAQCFENLRFLTIGTVMEAQIAPDFHNAYVVSKAKLSEFASRAGKQTLRGRILHLRLHTLYGDAPPHPHMFLGQILASIREGRPFAMSSGKQYRQYHHADDVSRAILALTERERLSETCLQLNSAETFQLQIIARSIFKEFGCEALLKVGLLSGLAGEIENNPNYVPTFQESDRIFRPTISGIVSCLRKQL